MHNLQFFLRGKKDDYQVLHIQFSAPWTSSIWGSQHLFIASCWAQSVGSKILIILEPQNFIPPYFSVLNFFHLLFQPIASSNVLAFPFSLNLTFTAPVTSLNLFRINYFTLSLIQFSLINSFNYLGFLFIATIGWPYFVRI